MPVDDTFPAVYSIYRLTDQTWTKIAETHRLSYADHAPGPGVHRYRVTAADYENNVSAPSAEAEVLVAGVTAAGPGVEPPAVVRDRRKAGARLQRHLMPPHGRPAWTTRSPRAPRWWS